MLPVETLNQIIANAIAANGVQLDTHTPTTLVGDQFGVVNLEQYQEGRSRFRGIMSTSSLAHFCNYTLREAQHDLPEVFVDQDAMTATAFYNLGNVSLPGHADHQARLKLKATAAYLALHAIAGKRLTQQELAEWMEDWNQQLVVLDASDKTMTVAAAVQKVRTITIKAQAERTSTETNFGAARSSMDSIEASHAEQQPAELRFEFEPYPGLAMITAVLRVSILTDDAKPGIKLRWVREEAQREEIALNFAEALKAGLTDDINITLGVFSPGN